MHSSDHMELSDDLRHPDPFESSATRSWPVSDHLRVGNFLLILSDQDKVEENVFAASSLVDG